MTYYTFLDQFDFKAWLESHYDIDDGIWIRFDKWKQTSNLTPKEALLVALSFGWIDGLIKKIDDQYYIKYFKKRSKHSIWSTLNKSYAEALIKDHLMKPSGLKQVIDAKNDGRWDLADLPPVDFDMDHFKNLLSPYQTAYHMYQSMSKSIQKTYALSYYSLKKKESRDKKLLYIIDRLEKGLKPM